MASCAPNTKNPYVITKNSDVIAMHLIAAFQHSPRADYQIQIARPTEKAFLVNSRKAFEKLRALSIYLANDGNLIFQAIVDKIQRRGLA